MQLEVGRGAEVHLEVRRGSGRGLWSEFVGGREIELLVQGSDRLGVVRRVRGAGVSRGGFKKAGNRYDQPRFHRLHEGQRRERGERLHAPGRRPLALDPIRIPIPAALTELFHGFAGGG